MLLRSVSLRSGREEWDSYPFNLPVIRGLREQPLAFTSPVTILVGENGSGKSTLLEGIACAANSIAIGSNGVDADPSLVNGRRLGEALKLVWTARTRAGFFLRAEDFFGYAKYLDGLRADLEREMAAIASDSAISERSRGLGQMAYARELAALRGRWGDGVDARSHGEAFLHLFQQRLSPGGLYLLDEPEAPLSPIRQLAMLSLLIHLSASGGSQFLIATHSPILMAVPGATLLLLDGDTIRTVDYDDLEHVQVTRQFLNDPAAFIRQLT